MSETVLITILGAYGASFIGFGAWAVAKIQDMAVRVTRLETILSMAGEKAARILHSPHTPELDRLLEHYWDHHYDLSTAEWKRLAEICGEIERNMGEDPEKRALAAGLGLLAAHKLCVPTQRPGRHAGAGTSQQDGAEFI